MLPIRIYNILQSWGVKPMEAVLLMVTGTLSYFLLKKADKKELAIALEKKT